MIKMWFIFDTILVAINFLSFKLLYSKNMIIILLYHGMKLITNFVIQSTRKKLVNPAENSKKMSNNFIKVSSKKP